MTENRPLFENLTHRRVPQIVGMYVAATSYVFVAMLALVCLYFLSALLVVEVARQGYHKNVIGFFWRNESGNSDLDWLSYGLPLQLKLTNEFLRPIAFGKYNTADAYIL